MRAVGVLAAAALLGLLAFPAAGGAALPPHPVIVFYYPWYGTPHSDGGYQMWTQNGHRPPNDIYSAFFPQRGVYSSSDSRIQAQQLTEIRAAGIDEIVISWWGRGSPTDVRLPSLLRAAARHGLAVAVHVEPYGGRTAQSVADDVRYLAGLGITDLYVYWAELIPAADWAAVRPTMPQVHLYAQTPHVGFAAAAHFDGVYTYDIVGYGGGIFDRYCGEAHRAGLVCLPSVGPGYTARRADSDKRVKPRLDGATYDRMWTAALGAAPDGVTITSYNEWGEGTQIEPARQMRGYDSYDGAWGLHGAGAATAYMARTAYWAARFHGLH